MKYFLLAWVLAANAFAAQPVLTRISPDSLAKLQQMDPMSRLVKPIGDAARINRPLNQSIPLQSKKLVGSYLPTAEIKVTTFDPYRPIRRTRVDQPFILEIDIDGLLPGLDFPLAATSVLLERHLASYQNGITTLDRTQMVAGPPVSAGYLSDNGKTALRFEASALTAADPTKSAGEEHFVIHVLYPGSYSQTQIASGSVQVWPVASGVIRGIAQGDVIQSHMPNITLQLEDLYPRSDTYLLLFEGTQISGAEGTPITDFSMDRKTSESHVIGVHGLDSKITRDGTYTLALVSDTVFGRDLLSSVTFSVHRNPPVKAMLVEYSGKD